MTSIWVDTISNSAGTGLVTLNKTQLAKCSGIFNQQTHVAGSYTFNVSSLSDHGVGSSRANHTNSMSAINQPATCDAGWPTTSWRRNCTATGKDATSYIAFQHAENDGYQDSAGINFSRYGVLA